MDSTRHTNYPYLEEINDGILRRFRRLPKDFLPSGQRGRVLDVGCGRAALGGAIRERGWEVWGVEQSPEACTTARTRLDRLIEADLTDFASVEPQLQEQEFDVLVFSDVLEHLVYPTDVLRRYLRRVRPGGRVFVSVPNMVVWSNRLRLLCGIVDPTDTGVMDRTHLRFFSFRVARRMVTDAGCVVNSTDSTPHLARTVLPLVKMMMPRKGPPNPRALIDSPLYRWYLRWVYPVEHAVGSLCPGLLGFRIIVDAVKPAPQPVPDSTPMEKIRWASPSTANI
jgi:2-polyprenyl-3-methyl-5-hydroxy-6-metoxy-1,4-benzoquinol methylase